MKRDKRTNNDLQNTIQKTKDRVRWSPVTTGDELMWSGRVDIACSTGHEWGNDQEVLTTSRTYSCHLGHIYSVTVSKVMVATVKLSKWWLQLNHKVPLLAPTLQLNHKVPLLAPTLQLNHKVPLLAPTLYHDRNHKFWNIGSTERYIFDMEGRYGRK